MPERVSDSGYLIQPYETLNNTLSETLPSTATSVLKCPADSSDLQDDGQRLKCTKCSRVYRSSVHSPIDFVGEAAYYWGEIPRSQMERILSHARQHGFEAAIDDLLGGEIDPSYRASLRDPTRIDWRLLLGMTKCQSVLDVGSGWGRLGFALAPWIGHLYSLEYIQPRLDFQQVMLEQRRDSNITLIRGSFLDLPFHPESIDWVVFNGVFEWVGLAGTKDPEEMQRDVLRASFEIAKPGGHVVVAIENRWGLNTFFGAVDHSGLPFTNLMPRRLADWWVRRRDSRRRNDSRGSGYRTYTYGLSGYKSLMLSAGAESVRTYALLPHYNTPRAIVPVDPLAPSAAQSYATDEVWQRATVPAAVARLLIRALIHLRLMRYIYPHYLVVGRKPC